MLSAAAAATRVEDTGVRPSILVELALKTLYLHGEMSVRQLADAMRISYGVAEQLFERLRREQLCEVVGMIAGIHRITTTSAGRLRAMDLLAANQYAGPAPVCLNDYNLQVCRQTIRSEGIQPEQIARAFEDMVFENGTVDKIGAALTSGQSIFLYGPTGTGKTSAAERLATVFASREILVPYAVQVDGQIVTVYDPSVHESCTSEVPNGADRRWIVCKRPRIIVGGELSLEMLDLQFNPSNRFYTAPVQMKANNGVLIIDDFGRQRIRPEQLLNRWIRPLEKKPEVLTLAGGTRIEVVFDVVVVFATNLNPREVMDDAFLRRIQSKISFGNISPAGFKRILYRECENIGLNCDESAADCLIQLIQEEWHQPLRPCYARDLVNQIRWTAVYEGTRPNLDEASLSKACSSYFVAE